MKNLEGFGNYMTTARASEPLLRYLLNIIIEQMAEFWSNIFHDLNFYKLSIQTLQSAFSSIFLSAEQHRKCQKILYCPKVTQSLSNINSDKQTIKRAENLVKTDKTIRFNPV